MRSFLALLLVLLGFNAVSLAQLQQPSCPSGTNTTTITGKVFAPNGVDPLPNVLVYIPQAAVDPFTPGVSCPVVGAAPSGNPLVGATSGVDGSFEIDNAPAGINIPLVIVSGRWRRQLMIPTVTACAANPLPSQPVTAGQTPTAFAVFPSTQAQGDIPKIAVATGNADSVECVLRKVGIADSEFTDPAGNSNGYVGRVNFFTGEAVAGAEISSSTPTEASLMAAGGPLNQYDVLMLPCEGQAFGRATPELQDLAAFANGGGRVYASHYAYSWMDTTTTFSTVAKWLDASNGQYTSELAAVDPSFSGGTTLSQWLQETGASTTPGQITLSTVRQTQSGVVAPTQSWLKVIDASGSIDNVTMQFVWDAPVATASTTPANQCGRVLFNEYHVEQPTGTITGKVFPAECPAAGTALSPQEKLLEYSLFELTNDGGAFTLTPASAAFPTTAVGFNSAPQTFTFTNNSTFSTTVSAPVGSQDFNIASNNCGTVAGYGTCQITVVYNPSVLGAETGTLSVTASGTTLTAALTGTGIPDLTLSTTSLTFGSVDVGASVTQNVAITNGAPGAVPVPAIVTTGDYSATSSCGSTLAAGAQCAIMVTFKPSTSGSRTGTLVLQTPVPGTPATLTGNGIDFTFTASPTSSTVTTTTPLAGFNNQLSLTCTTSAPGSICSLSPNSFAPSAAVTTNVTITTTARYSVVGYGGFGGSVWFALLGLLTGGLLWMKRRGLGTIGRRGLTVMLLALSLGLLTMGITGCSGKLPAQNANYTVPGTYTYTISATDGFLVHAATYSLTVTAK
jgi:hypothetical protein